MLLVVSAFATFIAWTLFSLAKGWAATDPIEGMVVLSPVAGGLLATAVAAGAAISAIGVMRIDGVPMVARRVVTIIAVIGLGASIAVPMVVAL